MKYLASIDLQQNQLVQARIENLATDPSSARKGQIYFNNSTGRLRYAAEAVADGDSSDVWIELDAAVEAITANAPLTATVSGTTVTLGINATDANTANYVVQRDASGDFSAGTITAALSGNASTATALQTGRTISLGGDLTGSATFDGTANITISATVNADSVALGTDTTGDYVESVGVSGTGLSVSGTGEGATVTITSNATDANTASTVVARDASGNFSAGTITANLSGNVTGTVSSLSNHDTDDLAEGSTNLYYTDTRVQANRLDQMSAPTSNVNLNNQKIVSLADPTNDQDAATKAYVDAARMGMDFKESVVAATTANIDLTQDLENGDTIDGVPLATGDRVLVKNQSTAADNGIYVVVASGAASRAEDADAGDITPGMFVFVEQGSTNADSGWVLSTDGTITVGSTALSFVQFSGAGQITAGDGLTKTGNTIDVVGTVDRITANANSIDIASTYVGQTSITTVGTIGTGTWQGDAVAVAYGGTGASTAAGARSNLGATTKYAATITGDGSTTSFTVNHALGTSDVVVMIYDNSSGTPEVVHTDLEITDANNVEVMFDVAPVGGGTPQTYRVTVIG